MAKIPITLCRRKERRKIEVVNASVKSPAKPSKAKPVLLGIGAVLLIGALLFGWGFLQGRAGMTEQQSQFAYETQAISRQLNQSQSDLTQSRRETEEAKNLSRVMQARGELYRSAVDLEQRNFGTANTHLRQSAVLLGEVGTGANIDTTRVNAVRDALAKTNIAVASDLGAQRALSKQMAR